MTRTLRPRTLALALVACLAAAAPAHAGSRLTIRGAGFGHGVGMSQYGAYGFALHGAGYREILGHYYQGTALGSVEPGRAVRVLLQSPSGAVSFSGATRAGTQTLDPAKTYRATRRGPTEVDLRESPGRRVATFTAPLQVAGVAGVVLGGRAINGRTSGAYRGVLELRPTAFGLNAINVVALDDYVRGVVPVESPASWPLEALKAQAVAARSYAITTSKGGDGFDQYPDTRSQVYGGLGVETWATNLAVTQTAGQVVTYGGRPVVTYFFSTSGGRTENVENSLGGMPQPWLRSVDDPYDDASPRHRWGPVKMTLAAAQRKLRGLVNGSLRGIEVMRRGRSPRVLEADVVGSRGRTRVSGATLRSRFGLYDTWAYYTSITMRKAPPAEAPVELPPQWAPGEGTGGVTPAARMTRFPVLAALKGTVLPARDGEPVEIQRRDGGWRTVATVRVHGGAYGAAITAPGAYRALFRGDAGATVRVG